MKRHRSLFFKLLLSLLAILLIALIAVWLIGPRRIQNLFHKELSDAPAPTTVPLLALSTVEGPTPTPTAAAQPTPIPETVPTRVVPPAEPINLPPGFGISVFAQGLGGPRMMALGPDGQLYVAERGAGRIVRLPDRDGDGVADGVEVVAEGLSAPSSIAFYADGSLYVGETTRVLRLSGPDGDGVFQEREVVVDGLPSGGHNTRTVLFSPDWSSLFVSVGSSCNVCVEEDARRATIVRYNPDGSGEEIYARGLRNAVGIIFRPGSGRAVGHATTGATGWATTSRPRRSTACARGTTPAGRCCQAGRIVDPEFGGPDACEGILAAGRRDAGPLGAAGVDLLHGPAVPGGIPGRPVRRLSRLVEPQRADRVQGGAHPDARMVRPARCRILPPVGCARTAPTGAARSTCSPAADGSLFVSDDSGGVIYRIFYAGE